MIIERTRKREVTREEEQRVREAITHVTRSSRASLLHIPDGESTDPICPYGPSSSREWYRYPIETIPVGYDDFCSHCVDRLDGEY